MGRLSTRLSSRACVSASIQCRSSKTRSSGCTWLSRSSTRLSACERALAALRRVEGAKRTVLRQHLQEGQQRREGVLQGLVERQHLAGHLGPHRAGVVPLVEVTVALEQVDDGEVGRRLAIGHRGALQHPPALRGVGMDKLIDQARLAHTGLAHQRHHLAVPGCRLRQRLVQGLELVLPPHKARQPPGGSGLEAPPQRTGPHQLKDRPPGLASP